MSIKANANRAKPTESDNLDIGDIEDAMMQDSRLCGFFEKFSLQENAAGLEKGGIYALDDLKEYGKAHNLCPYFMTR